MTDRQPDPTPLESRLDQLRERVLELLMFSYEAVHDAAERGRIDFSTAGEPLVEAIKILRRGRVG